MFIRSPGCNELIADPLGGSAFRITRIASLRVKPIPPLATPSGAGTRQGDRAGWQTIVNKELGISPSAQ